MIRACCYALFLSCLIVYPSWQEGYLIGHPNLDVWSHAWGMDWFSSMLRSGRFPWYVEGVAWPKQRVLWYIDPIGAFMMTPFSWFLGPIVSYNLLIGIQIFLLGIACWLCARKIGGSGWLAMTILCSSPFLLGEYWNGVVEAGWVATIPFAAYLALCGSRWTGLIVGLAAVATPYHGMSAALLVSTIILGTKTQSIGVRLRRLLVAGILAILVSLPHLLLIRASFHSEISFVHRNIFEGYNPAVLISNAVDPKALYTMGDFWSQKINDSAMSVPWHKTPYLGWFGIAGSLGILVCGCKVRALWIPALVGLTCTLGIFLWSDGAWVQTPEKGMYQLPLAYLAQWLPLPLDHPMRFVGGVVCCLALMSDRFFGKIAWLVCGFVLYEQLYLAPSSWPLPNVNARPPALYTSIPDKNSAVLDLPSDLGAGNQSNRYLFWQRLHKHPVPWSNKVSAIGVASQNQAVIKWASFSRDVEGYIEGLDPDAIIAKETLRDENYGAIILHISLLKNTQELRKYEEISEIFGYPQKEKEQWMWILTDR